ncbi:NADH dehydrogenase (ubiquinone) 1 alpha subcomplex subunit 4, partial [Phenoliferia sp. Uapishka_3]
MAVRFAMGQPALAPLFAAVGLGIGGSVAFAAHYLSNSPDVVIRNKKTANDPWNQVHQGQNTKLFSWNEDFWKSRQTMVDPRAMFKEDGSPTSDAVKIAKANAITKAAKMGKEESAH